MATLNRNLIVDAATGFRAMFQKGFESVKPLYGPFVERVTSDNAIEEHHLSAGLPGLRRWTGPRQLQNHIRHKMVVENVDYELTVAVNANDYKDDRLGIYRQDFLMMGAQAQAHGNSLFAAALTTGFSEVCYDGLPFFSASHQGGSNTGTDALDDAAFEAALDGMSALTNDFGEPLDLLNMGTEVHLVVPPQLNSTGRRILLNQFGDGGASNTNFGRAKLTVLPNLSTTPTAWYLLGADGPLRPFIYQVREEPTVVAKDMPTDDNVFFDREVIHGVQGRWAFSYGLWHLAFGSTGTT